MRRAIVVVALAASSFTAGSTVVEVAVPEVAAIVAEVTPIDEVGTALAHNCFYSALTNTGVGMICYSLDPGYSYYRVRLTCWKAGTTYRPQVWGAWRSPSTASTANCPATFVRAGQSMNFS